MAEGGGALRELVAFLGFDLDEKGLDKADDRIERTKKGAETLTRALEAVGIALGLREIGEFIEGQIEMGAAIERTSAQLGISTEDLQAFQYAAQTVGISTDEANVALRFLSKNIGDARLGNADAAKSFAHLHVAIRNADGSSRDMADIIADVADAFQKTHDPAKRTALAMQVFGRQGAALVPLLAKGGDGVEALYQEFEQLGGGLHEDFIEAAGEAEHNMVKLKTATRGLSSELGAVLLPYVSEFASALAEGLAKMRDWLRNTHGLRNGLIALGVVAAGLVITWGILNIEILLVVAALALLALAIDDVITFFEDGDSLLGRFLDKLFGLGKSKEIAQELRDAWKEVSDAFGTLWDSVKELGPTLKDLWNTFSQQSDVDKAKTGIQSIADAAASLAHFIKGALDDVNALLQKFDAFAKAHPTLIHLAERAQHEIIDNHDPSLIGGVGVLARTAKEAFTGDASDIDTLHNAQRAAATQYQQVPSVTAPGSIQLQQHNETHIRFSSGLPDVGAIQNAIKNGVQQGHDEANAAAFYAVGGGGAP